MSAIKQNKTAFQLFKRSDNDVVKARPYSGDHNAIVKACVKRVTSQNAETISELAKV